MAYVIGAIAGISGGIGPVGGWAEIPLGQGRSIELFRGTLQGSVAGEVTLTPLTWFGAGIAGQYLTATIPVECK